MELLTLAVSIVVGLFIFGIALNRYFRSLKIHNFTDKYVLITGCDTGIGNSTARKLDGLGFHVFAGCLSLEKAQELGSTGSDRLVAMQMDVSSEESVKESLAVVKQVLPEGKGLWAVINNAGVFGPVGLSQWFPKSKYEDAINVNFIGTMIVTTTFLPLVRRAKGRIVNMSSVMGRLGIVASPYTVSKFCVEGYTDWLRYQLYSQGISVVTVEPGGINTKLTDLDFHLESLKKEMACLNEDVQASYHGISIKKFRLAANLTCWFYRNQKVDIAADIYIHAVSARYPKTRYTFGLDTKLFFQPLWTLPTWMTDFIAGLFYRPLGDKGHNR